MNKNISWTYNEEFEKNGFFIIKNLCDPSLLYSEVPNEDFKNKVLLYDNRNKTYSIQENHPCCFGSISRRNFPLYEQFQFSIKPIIEDFIGRKLYITYCYDIFYFSNQELKIHTDQEQCEISCSLHISSNLKKYWDFKLMNPYGEEKSVQLNPGDAIVYKGIQIPHWRDPLPSRHDKKNSTQNDDTYYHQVFFHYVLQDGNYVQFAN
jgi:hypothetical protein